MSVRPLHTARRMRSIVFIMFCVGCSGWTEAHFANSTRDLRPRAAFDFSCPVSNLSLQSFDSAAFPSSVGVVGCGKKAVYVRTYRGWVLNSDVVIAQ
jgi:hypothetical protein